MTVLCNCEYCVKGRAVIDAAQAKAKDADVERFWKGLLHDMVYLGTTIVRVDPTPEFYAEPQAKAELKRTYPYIGYYTMKGIDNDIGKKFAVEFTGPMTGKVIWTDTTVYKLGDESKVWVESEFVAALQPQADLLAGWDDEPTFQEIVDDVLDTLASPGAYKPAQPFPSFIKHLAELQQDAMKRAFEARDAALFEQYPFLRQVNDELIRRRNQADQDRKLIVDLRVANEKLNHRLSQGLKVLRDEELVGA